MKAKTAIKSILSAQDKTYTDFADQLGISNAALWDRLNNKKNRDISVSTLFEMTEALGYNIIITPKDQSNPQYLINNED